jgi:hypothetical protein
MRFLFAARELFPITPNKSGRRVPLPDGAFETKSGISQRAPDSWPVVLQLGPHTES